MNLFSEKELNALESVRKHKNLEPYFFEKLIEKKDVKWLDLLKSRGFFDKPNVPVLSEGNYIEEWNVLNYVVSIMNELVSSHDENQILYILTVLLQAAETSKNFRVFNQSVEIIKRIPLSNISVEYINDFLDYWLDCEFGLDFILDKVESELLIYLLSDPEKTLLTFEKFLEKTISSFSRNNYVLDDLLTNNKDNLLYLFSFDPQRCCEFLIGLLENELFVESSTREANGHAIVIQNINDKMLKVSCHDITLEKVFETREIDTDFIIDNLKPSLEDVSDQELTMQVRLLYNDLFNKGAYESIFDQKDYLFEVDDYINHFMKVCLMESKLEYDVYNLLVSKLLKSNYDRVKKLGIFLIVEKWDLLRSSFLRLLENEVQLFDYIFRSYIYDDETKRLFELFNIEIDSKYYMLVDEIINKNEYFLHDRDDQHFKLKWKQKRYLALSNVPYFQEKLIEAKSITGVDIELSPAIKFSGVHSIEQISPFSAEEINNIPISELVIKMKNFRETNRFSDDFKELSYRGFGSEIKSSLISYPDHFIDDLRHFNELQYEFIYYLLDGFSVLVKQNIDLNYNKILDFLILYISNDGFWDGSFRIEKDNSHLMTHKSVLKASYDFIIALVANDKFNFTKSEFELIYNIIDSCLSRIDFSQVEDVLFSNKDISFYSLNSLGGRFVKTLLELALKVKRVAIEDYEVLWGNKVKTTIEHLMEISCVDSFVIFGEYLANFAYVDLEWTKQKIKSIKPDQEMWQYFMTGYLDSGVVYYEFYELMVDNYLEAIEYKGFVDKDIKEKLGIHIAIGYINGFEEKTKVELINKILDIFDISIMEVMVRYFYNIEKKQLVKGVSKSDAVERVLKFWTQLIEKCSKESNGIENIKLIQQAVNIINNFSTINELIATNLSISFKYMISSFGTHHVVDYCERLITKPENNIFTIPLIFELFSQCIPSYPEDKIKLLLLYLKQNNENEKLELIRHSYLTKTKKSFVVEYISEILR
ncbi:hypothetical protein M2444_006766 [Paenibacillus sp. PastF-3]|jgi:hypothetical protein|uniref:hypothetical protein n=1 Tax=unclassified Paenibacillus TaxID=185978 RepID=UPI002476ED7F|nr:hypothetical protein [Paenibacillus sp. PastF-3]MDH6374902.1 hypothetical protein [Paenibacillus sp. PastF-3]